MYVRKKEAEVHNNDGITMTATKKETVKKKEQKRRKKEKRKLKRKKKKQNKNKQTNKKTDGTRTKYKKQRSSNKDELKPGAGIMEADDRQVTTVFTDQPSFHHRHSTNRAS